MSSIQAVADNADMIVNGYAFTKDDENIRVLNLNNNKKSLYLSKNGKVINTSMDDIEIGIVKHYYTKNDSFIQEKGILNDREIRNIQTFIKNNYQEMYLKWAEYSKEGYYEK